MNKKILIILFAAVIIIIGAFLLLRKPSAQNNNPSAPTDNSSTQTNNPITQPSDSTTSVNPKTYNITIENFSFKPAELKIKKGDTVVWTNQDSSPHQILESNFKSEKLNNGQSFRFVFETVGTFNYICSIHPSMKGKIIVE